MDYVDFDKLERNVLDQDDLNDWEDVDSDFYDFDSEANEEEEGEI